MALWPDRDSDAGGPSINGLRSAEHMVENRLLRRPLYGRGHAAVRIPNESERRAQARQAAEALFAPKPPAAEPAVDPPSTPVPPELVGAATTREPLPRAVIPTAHVARIRTWVKYGMTIAQVAAIYGVDAGEIARLVGKA
jgi:hypothetical protein